MASTNKKKQQEVPTPKVEARIDRLVDGDFKTNLQRRITGYSPEKQSDHRKE